MSLRERLSALLSLPSRAGRREGASPLRPAARGTADSPQPGDAAHPRAAPNVWRPPPPDGACNYLLIVLDSCRFDSFVAARPRNMSRLGTLHRRFSYASWTSPAHFNLLMGLLPHPSPTNVYASDHYREDFKRFRERLGVEGLSFLDMLPRLWLPATLRQRYGYYTRALTSLPVLNPDTPLNADFDSFELMDRHNDLAGMLKRLRFAEERPTFLMMNVGETHYPYALPEEPEDQWPRIHGVNGVFKHLDTELREGRPVRAEGPIFDAARLEALRARQVEAVRYVDGLVGQLYDLVPPRTTITITADHGELFGEGGYFGHGPINHEKVLEVPFLEGRIR